MRDPGNDASFIKRFGLAACSHGFKARLGKKAGDLVSKEMVCCFVSKAKTLWLIVYQGREYDYNRSPHMFSCAACISSQCTYLLWFFA